MLTALKTKRLLVSRQDSVTRQYSCIGELRLDGDDYVFVYDPSADRAMPGLPLGQVHRSSELFPIFAERVVHPLRSDRDRSLELLGLGPEASPFEVLAVSGGRRAGDTYELTPLPEAGEVELPFLVHGIRHLKTHEQAQLEDLRPGDQLEFEREPSNPKNKRALLVTRAGVRLGYVPDPLVEHIHEVMQREFKVTVERVNPPDAGFHMRLLVVIHGRLEGAPEAGC
ncbi:hypothetical protein ASG90_04435 [Nocardioides sp. Soil797]|nr:hypothetical protein ASG90_04435 [Nocardioides sp. Soil797]